MNVPRPRPPRFPRSVAARRRREAPRPRRPSGPRGFGTGARARLGRAARLAAFSGIVSLGAAPVVAEPAAPDTGHYYTLGIALGATLLPDDGGDDQVHLGFGLVAGTGLRLSPAIPVFLRAGLGAGLSSELAPFSDDAAAGAYVAPRIGVEIRGCGRAACLFGGADLGLVAYAYDAALPRTTFHQLVPRAGYEVGHRRRIGLTVEYALDTGDSSASGLALAATALATF